MEIFTTSLVVGKFFLNLIGFGIGFAEQANNVAERAAKGGYNNIPDVVVKYLTKEQNDTDKTEFATLLKNGASALGEVATRATNFTEGRRYVQGEARRVQQGFFNTFGLGEAWWKLNILIILS